MTEIYAGSDIHLEFGGPIVVPECDVLLLSGDIFTAWRHPEAKDNHQASLHKREKKFFQQCQDKAAKTLIILGNHEHYNGTFGHTIERARAKLDWFPNIELLNNDTVEFDDFAVFGSTFWTDMNQSHPEVMWHANRVMTDFSVIFKHRGNGYLDPSELFRAHDTVVENTYARKKLVEFLSLYADDEKRKTIVMTHHAPTYACVDRKFSVDMLTYAFANTGLDDMLLDNDGPHVWLYGHMHHRKEFLHGDKTRIIANARGYFNTNENGFVKTFAFRKIEL